jgi:sucrose-6-phosphate hydrolase SacC (GH32 family)
MADFRDPSVSWDPIAHHWVMAVSLPKEHKISFYSSPNLKLWALLSDFGPTGDINGDWECPDLLHIPSSNGAKSIWALKVGLNPGAPQGGSGEQYFLGTFDGKTFRQSHLRGSHGWTNYGKDDYCAISYNNLPKDQKPVLIGWMSNWQYASQIPTTPWRWQMSIPRRLSYIDDAAGLALKQEPIIAPLRAKNYEISDLAINTSALYGSGHTIQPPFEIRLHFGHPVEPVFGLKIYSDSQHWTEVGFDTNKKEFYIDRTHSGVAISPEFRTRTKAPLVTTRPYDLTLIVDRSSVEAFAQDGTIAMTDLVFPVANDLQIQIFPDDAKPIQSEGQLWELKSIW